MFESVDLPAPFSPSSAWTSPTAASKSTASFASTPGKRLLIPRMLTADWPGAPANPPLTDRSSGRPNGSTLRAADHALHEPVHGVQILDGQPLALGDAELAGLVVQRPPELVELAGDQRRALRPDRGLRHCRHARPARRHGDGGALA